MAALFFHNFFSEFDDEKIADVHFIFPMNWEKRKRKKWRWR